MNCQYQIACPNCGRSAKRTFTRESQRVITQCDACDYLLISSVKTGRVIEAYSPGISVHAFQQQVGCS